MIPEIQKQYSLMTKAMWLLERLQSATILEKPIIEQMYAETMGELAGELLSLRKVNITIHEEIHY